MKCDCRKILIVEAPSKSRDQLVLTLAHSDICVAIASTASEAREVFNIKRPGIVLIDIDLFPGEEFSLVKEFRQINPDLLTLLSTDKNDPNLRLQGYEVGIDDLLVRPYVDRELLLRLRKRCSTNNSRSIGTKIKLGNIDVDFEGFTLTDGSGEIHALNSKECEILRCLYFRQGNAVTRKEILSNMPEKSAKASTRTIDNYIVRFRRIFGTDLDCGVDIESIHGVGYKLVYRNTTSLTFVLGLLDLLSA